LAREENHPACWAQHVEPDEFEMTWRMAKVAGAIDTTVRLVETVIRAQPMFKFQSSVGKETAIRDLAGLARSLQAATSVRQGVRIEPSSVRSLEDRLVTIQAEMNAMLAQLAQAAVARP
jgi:hypothetical protein